MSSPKKKKPAKREASGDELTQALKDVLQRTPKSITIEFDKAVEQAEQIRDDNGGWSGNVYKYNF